MTTDQTTKTVRPQDAPFDDVDHRWQGTTPHMADVALRRTAGDRRRVMANVSTARRAFRAKLRKQTSRARWENRRRVTTAIIGAAAGTAVFIAIILLFMI